jgi:hypothetical protein
MGKAVDVTGDFILPFFSVGGAGGRIASVHRQETQRHVAESPRELQGTLVIHTARKNTWLSVGLTVSHWLADTQVDA